MNGDREAGLCLSLRFALQNFQRALRFDFGKFSVFARKGQSKYRPVFKFQCLKILLLTQSSLLSAFPKPALFAPLVRKRRVVYIALSIPERAFYHFHRRSNMAEMKVRTYARRTADTPRKNRRHIIKVGDLEEKLRIAYACKDSTSPPNPNSSPRPVRRERQAHRCGGAGRRGYWRRLPPCLPVQQGGSSLNQLAGAAAPAAKGTETAPGANARRTVHAHELSAESRKNGNW